MTDNLNPTQKSSPFRFLRVAGGIIIIWVATLLLSYLLNIGMFGSWIQTDKPPSGVKRIINASSAEIWFETQDGKLYDAWWGYGQFAEFHLFWSPINDISEIPEQKSTLTRGNDCKKLHASSFVQNPPATLIECVYVESQNSKPGSYYALTTDGNVLIWRRTDGMILFILFICNIPLTIVAIISIIYFIFYIVARIKHTAG